MGAISSLLVQTKLQPPRPMGGTIDRPRLTALLRAAIARRVTLLVADAGWGKTSALAQLQSLGIPLVWYSLDRGDDDPAVLAAHLLVGFDAALPGLAEEVRDSGAGTPRAIVAQLTNALVRRGNPSVVVALDDLHHLGRRSHGMRLLLDLIAWPPSGLRVVAASRRLPPWPLARLKSSGELSVLGQAQLAFTAEEIDCFLSRMLGRRLVADDLVALTLRTEGWPVALRLLAQGWAEVDLRDRSGAAWLRDYVHQEILTALSVHDRRLLMAAAFLERFDGPVLDQVLERIGSSSDLNRLAERGGLLVGSAWGDGYQRLHYLLSDLLREEARAELTEAELRRWHARAGDAWLACGAHRDAVEHFLKAGEYEAAASAVEGIGFSLFDVPALETMEHWLARLGEGRLRRPGMRFLLGQLAHRRGRYPAALPHLEAALSAYRAQGDRRGVMACSFLLLETFLFLERAPAVLGLAETLRAELEEVDWAKFASIYPVALALNDRFSEAMAAWRTEAGRASAASGGGVNWATWGTYAHYVLDPVGRMDEAGELLERVVARLRERDVYGRLAMSLALLGQVQFDLGRWEDARRTMDEAGERAVAAGWPGYLSPMRLLQARIAVAAGDDEAARDHLRSMPSGPGDDASFFRSYFLPVVQAVLAARVGDLARRDREAAQAREAVSRVASAYLRGEALLELAPAFFEPGDFPSAAGLALEVLDSVRALPVPYLRARAHLLLAAVRAGLGDEAGARSAWADAMHEARSCRQETALRQREARLLERLMTELRVPVPSPSVLDLPLNAESRPALSGQTTGLRIQSLGHFEVWVDGQRRVRWRRRRDRQVFKLLLTSHPNAVSRDVLIDVFWPELPRTVALTNLQNSVSQIRRALEAAGAYGPRRVVYEGEAYRLELGPEDRWDVAEVRRLDPVARAGDLASARRLVALTRGEYLAADRYAEWAELVRQEVWSARRRALQNLRDVAQARGEAEEAVAWAERLVQEDPTSEADQARLIALLAAAGHRQRALAQYEQCVAVLSRELGVHPSPTTQAVAAAVRASVSAPIA